MSPQELEDLYIRSLDQPMTREEKEKFFLELDRHPELARRLDDHKKVRTIVAHKKATSFGPYFASKLVHRIENTGVMIDRQLFSFFKKFQLAAVGVVVALLILNILLTDQKSFSEIFGLKQETTTTTEDSVSFDFFKTLNEDL